ncbi:hypothetical protein HUX88_22460 [Duganella sp. BJB1802]|uniref:hypothetical protein n=1 Tax=Duganella sp. BJB1802 TaxID=2744575 RepID=UPI0015942444|nr:hypothetical protein [Duganella sp. BJB1802]NVD73281.1 hypothetical protein [Duganella sp. BJB1802]
MAMNSENEADLRFVLLEIGKLSSNVERLITDVKFMGEKVDGLRHQVTFVRGALYVVSGVLAAGVYYVAALYR